jgi:hypothetical protein
MNSVTKINAEALTCAALFVIVMIASCSVKKPPEIIPPEEVFNVTALINEAAKNETGFSVTHNAQRIRIAGVVSGKATPKDNPPETDFNYLTFGENSEDGIFVLCYFNEYIFWDVEIGEELIVEGNFRSVDPYGANRSAIIFGECKIIRE